jgi:hypothetical protein
MDSTSGNVRPSGRALRPDPHAGNVHVGCFVEHKNEVLHGVICEEKGLFLVVDHVDFADLRVFGCHDPLDLCHVDQEFFVVVAFDQNEPCKRPHVSLLSLSMNYPEIPEGCS